MANIIVSLGTNIASGLMLPICLTCLSCLMSARVYLNSHFISRLTKENLSRNSFKNTELICMLLQHLPQYKSLTRKCSLSFMFRSLLFLLNHCRRETKLLQKRLKCAVYCVKLFTSLD